MHWLHKCYHCGRFVISDETTQEDCPGYMLSNGKECGPGRRMKTIGLGFFENLDEAQRYVLRTGLPDDLPISPGPREQKIPFDVTKMFNRPGGIH